MKARPSAASPVCVRRTGKASLGIEYRYKFVQCSPTSISDVCSCTQ